MISPYLLGFTVSSILLDRSQKILNEFYMANLSDRGAVEALAARIDWKYALGMDLTEPGFDPSVLTLFRSRLLNGGKEKLILDKLLERCQKIQLIKAKGKARTDSTHILAAIRNLNRLEYVGETLRSALNALAIIHPDWLSNLVPPDWFDRYSKPVEESRLPRGTDARNQYAEIIGLDGMKILKAIYDESTTPQWLRAIPAVETLRIFCRRVGGVTLRLSLTLLLYFRLQSFQKFD
jgi:transposase